MSSWLLSRYRNHWIFVQIAVYIANAFSVKVLNLFSTYVYHTVSISPFQQILEIWLMYIRFLEFKRGVCVRQRERMSEFIHNVDISSCFPVWKTNHGSTWPTLLTLSGSVSLTVEVVMIGPESHVSHAEGGAAFVFVLFFLFFFQSRNSSFSTQNMQPLSMVLPFFWWYIFLRLWEVKRRGSKLCLKFPSLIFVECNINLFCLTAIYWKACLWIS